MERQLMSNLRKVKTDLKYLNHLVTKNLKRIEMSNGCLDGKDEEFKGSWNLYEKLRKDLNNLNHDLFKELRELPMPKPDMSNSLYKNGIYSQTHIRPLQNEIERAIMYFNTLEKLSADNVSNVSQLTSLFLLVKRFHRIVRQLRKRHNNRQTIEIEDEYDVQDLFHSLLQIYFDDIRSEEWTPSYAGGTSRMDFLLKTERIVIEIKKTRQGLTQKEIGEQLIIDIEKYQSHPDCKTLFCFVYDPEAKIVNPNGIENDLSKPHSDIKVIVVIEPK